MRYVLVCVTVLTAAFLTAACSASTGPCPPVALVPAVQVEVRDSTTGAPLADGSTGVVRDGAYTDSLRPWARNGDTLITLGAAFQRAGTYDVTVEHPGYATWRRTGVVVRGNSCGVPLSVTLPALLQPAP